MKNKYLYKKEGLLWDCRLPFLGWKMLLACFFTAVVNGYAQLIPNLGGQRAGISAFTFLKDDISPRAIGLGGAITTMKGDGYASQWNPAALTDLTNHTYVVSTRIYPIGMYQAFAAANIKLTENDVITASINNLNSGSMQVTTEFQPNGTGQYFSYNAMAVGVSYAKALTYRFSVGLTLKYLNEMMDVYSTSSGAFDLGFIYRTDFKDLRFGVFLQNFGPNTTASGSYQPYSFTGKTSSTDGFSSPTVFKFGASMILYKNDRHSFVIAAELNHPGDNATNIRFGVEYNYIDLLFFRTGYWINRPGFTIPTAGVGLRTIIKNQIVYFNYAFATHSALGVQHNIGFSVTINKVVREKTEVEEGK